MNTSNIQLKENFQENLNLKLSKSDKSIDILSTDSHSNRSISITKDNLQKSNMLFEQAHHEKDKENQNQAIKLQTEGLLLNQRNHEAQNEMGQCQFRMNMKQESLQSFFKSLLIQSQSQTPLFNIAQIQEDEKEQHDAIVQYKLCLTSSSNTGNDDNILQTCKFRIGKCQYKKNELTKSLEYFSECLKIITDDDIKQYKTLNEIAKIYRRMNKYHEAIQVYYKCLKKIPNNIFTQNDLGLCQQKIGKTNKAIQQQFESISINENNQIAYYNLGRCNSFLGNYNLAIEQYNKSLKQNPYQAKAIRSHKIALSKIPEQNSD